MPSECSFCNGFISCDDPPDCDNLKTLVEVASPGTGWKHKGCFCVGSVDGEVQLVDCGGGFELQLSVWTKGNEVRIYPTDGVCLPTN